MSQRYWNQRYWSRQRKTFVRVLPESEINGRVERHTAHLDRLLLNMDMTVDAYRKAMMDLSQWKEQAILKLREHGP